MAVVVVLLVIVVLLAAVTVWLALAGQRSRARRGDQEWQRKVGEEYTPPAHDED